MKWGPINKKTLKEISIDDFKNGFSEKVKFH